MKESFRTIPNKVLNKETVLYLIFGVIATILNIVLYHLFVNVIQMSTAVGNILDTVICVFIQYFTNRLWVFKSNNSGKEAFKEFLRYIIARIATAIIDEVIVVVGVDIIVNGIVEKELQPVSGVVVKIFSSMTVILLNYIFSKRVVFKKNQDK